MQHESSVTLYDPNNKFWANDTSSFAYKMMQKMGWTPGKGLGLNEDGQVKALSVEVKQDNLGIGAKEARAQGWLETSRDYREVLGNMKELKAPQEEPVVCVEESETKNTEKTKKKHRSKDSKKKKEKSSSKGENSEKRKTTSSSERKRKRKEETPNNEKSEEKREDRRKRRKLTTTESKEGTEERSKSVKTSRRKSSRSFTTTSPPESSNKSHTHFIPKRVMQGKSVASYSQQDLNAIFGFTSDQSAATMTPRTNTVPEKEEPYLVKSTQNLNEYFESIKRKKEEEANNNDPPSKRSKK